MALETDVSSRLVGPESSATTSFAATVGTTHVVYSIPEPWKGARVSIKVKPNAAATSAAVWILFGSSASVEADRTVVVTGTPPAWTGDVKIARPIDAYETVDYFIKREWTHFSIESDENTNRPTISIFPSDDRSGVLTAS